MSNNPVQYCPPENHYIQLDVAFATEYGVNEALIFDKLYRLDQNWQGFIDEDGAKWIRLTYDEWEKELPFLSRNTIIRTLEHMESFSLILSTVFSGRSKWYRLNPDFVSTQNGQTHLPKMGISSTQNGLLPKSSPKSSPRLVTSNEVSPAQKSTSENQKSKTIPIKEKDKPKRPPAVDTYRSVANRFPDKATWPLLEEVTDLEFWEQVVRDYIACGWNKINIKGMLEFYDRRELPTAKKGGPQNGKAYQRNSRQTKKRTGEDLDKQPSYDPYSGETIAPRLS